MSPVEPVQVQHVARPVKRKAYMQCIKPAKGFDVLVADVMTEGPKHHPTVFKKGMTYTEAEAILAIVGGGNRGAKHGYKKMKLCTARMEDGTPVLAKGIKGYMLVPAAECDSDSVGSAPEPVCSQDAADLLLAFSHSTL